MNVTLVMVSSVNGKITNNTDLNVTHWTSQEDARLFAQLKKKQTLIVMGSATYKAAKQMLALSKKTLRIVLTRNPHMYRADSIPGQLEFTNESPPELIKRLSSSGYTEMLLAGGPIINALFFKSNLINAVRLTIEPLLFSKGKNLIIEDQPNIHLQLVKVQKLNRRGTLHLTYNVIY
jgi:dihydrofolate reductase